MLFSVALTGLLLIACIFDLKEFRIPNAIPLALTLIFLIKVATTADMSFLPWHLIAFGLAFALGFAGFALGLFGGGDAKLMSALALWIGLPALPSFLALTAIGGGMLALALIGLRQIAARQPMSASLPGTTPVPRLLDRHAPVPYALPMTFAALWLEWL